MSKGTELLQGLKDTPKVKEVITINSQPEIEQSVPEELEDTTRNTPEDMIDSGVEVVDVKAIERKKKLESQ